MHRTELAQKGKIPLAYVTGKNREPDALACEILTHFFSTITGWIWLIGNWTITLSVNFGMAALIGG
jgi:hypothetical protein